MIAEENEEQPSTRCQESPKTLIIFFIFGFLVCNLAGVILASAEVLLQGFGDPTGSLWVMYSIPFLIFSTIIPYVFDRLPPLYLVLSFFPLLIGGQMCLLLGKAAWMKYLGVFLIGTTDCISEVTAVSLTAYFHKTTILAFCVGSGIAYVFGPLYYTAMTSWLSLSHEVTIALLIIQPIGFLICYLLLEKRREHFHKLGYQAVTMPALENLEHLSWRQKLRASLTLLPQIIQIILGLTLHDLILSGVTTTIAFSSSPFAPVEHYNYYLILSFLGLCIGRSYLGFAELIKPGAAEKLLVRKSWLLVFVTVCHVVFLILASLYRFLPNVWVTLLVVFSLGIFSEAIYANVNFVFGEVEDLRVREMAMGLSVYGVGLGNLLGSVLAQPIEMALLEHCLSATNQSDLCFTRNVKFTDNIVD